MGLETAVTGPMLAAFAGRARWAALHWADGAAFETSAVRQLLTWSEPDRHKIVSAAVIEFAVTAGDAAEFVGYWTERYGGVYLGCRRLPEPKVFPWNGSYRIPARMLVEELVIVDGD